MSNSLADALAAQAHSKMQTGHIERIAPPKSGENIRLRGVLALLATDPRIQAACEPVIQKLESAANEALAANSIDRAVEQSGSSSGS